MIYYESPKILLDFLNYMETIRGKASSTTKEYYYDLRLFFRFLKLLNENPRVIDKNDYDLEKIDIMDINIDTIKNVTLSDLYMYMSFISKKRDNSATSRARKVASLKSFFNYLTNKVKLIKNNPTLELESPKILKRLPKYLNIEESKTLLSSIEGTYKYRDYAIITLFLNCGLRLSELVNINLNKIKNDTLTVIGKGGKERIVYLNSACKEAIKKYMTVRPNNLVQDRNALFISKRKKRISAKTVQHIVKKYIKQSGLDPERYSTHKLRHTAATLMYKHGKVDIRALQEILGHESISTTEIYTHVDNTIIKEALSSNPLSKFKNNKK